MKKQKRNPTSLTKTKNKKKAEPSKTKAWWHNKTILGLLSVGLILTLVVYIPSFSADFVNWDDGEYVQNNGMITSFSNFHRLWTTPVAGNYHPLTMLTLMINYSISGQSAFGYHLTNVILHLINVVLVFHFIYLLSDKKWQVALITAVLFGIHPMHVESVAWVSERKDVLFTTFFMGSLIHYLKYLKSKKGSSYGIALLLFALSLLSKPAAVVLPVTVWLIDWYRKRNIFDRKVISEKIPFFILAIGMGILTILVQSDRGAVADLELIPMSRKLFFACYGLMMYLGKLLVPIKLAAFYPFPSANVSMPVAYYISPAVIVVVACATYFLAKSWSRVVTFGMLFFVINIALVLQIISIGSAVMADRYTYVPYIGCFFIIGYGYYWFLEAKSRFFMPLSVMLGLGVLCLTFLGYQQTKTWHDSEALWGHALKVWPSAHAHTNMALAQRGKGDIDGSLEGYTKAIKMHSGDPTSYTNRGNIYFAKGKYELSIQDYNKAIQLNPAEAKTYVNRGASLSQLKKYDAALADFSKAVELNPNYAEAFKNRALTYDAMNQPENSVLDYSRYLEFHPRNHGIYNVRAITYNKLGRLPEALSDLSKAISLDGSIAMYYQNRAIIQKALGLNSEALSDAEKVKSLGGQLTPGFLESLE